MYLIQVHLCVACLRITVNSGFYKSKAFDPTLEEGFRGQMKSAPGPTRTADPLLRRQMLYPAELRAHYRMKELPQRHKAIYKRDPECQYSESLSVSL